MAKCDTCEDEYTHTRKVAEGYQYLCEPCYDSVTEWQEEEWELS